MLKIACPYHLLIWQKMFLPVFFFFESFLRVLSLSLSVYKTQNIITMELNKQLWSGFLYVMPYSIFFALIKKKNPYYRFIFHIKRILSHTATGLPPKKTDGFYDTLCVPPDLKGLNFWTRSFMNPCSHFQALFEDRLIQICQCSNNAWKCEEQFMKDLVKKFF